MPDVWPVTIRTAEGDFVEVDPLPSAGCVYIYTSMQGVRLSGAQREEFSRAYIAASWAAEGRVTSDATDPPLHYDEGITGMYWDNLGSGSHD